jgi:hypothetical protein
MAGQINYGNGRENSILESKKNKIKNNENKGEDEDEQKKKFVVRLLFTEEIGKIGGEILLI